MDTIEPSVAQIRSNGAAALWSGDVPASAPRTGRDHALRIAMIGARGLGTRYGGIETMLDEICPRLAGRGHSIDVYSRHDAPSVDAPGIKVVRVATLSGKHCESLSRSAVATVISAMRRHDIIHFHAVGPASFSLVSRALGRPSLATIHGLDWQRDKWSAPAKLALRGAEWALTRGASMISVVSGSLAPHFEARYGVSPLVIPNGAPLVSRAPFGAFGRSLGLRPENYLMFVGRLVPEKACHELLAAYRQIDSDMPLVIAGDGPADYAASLRAMTVPGRVIFTGQLGAERLAELQGNAALIVLPSHLEGMSMVLLEAMAQGRAILASDIPQNTDLMAASAAYFKVGDVDDLRRHLVALLGEPSLRHAISQRVVTAASRRPGWDEVTSLYETAYRAAIVARRRWPVRVEA